MKKIFLKKEPFFKNRWFISLASGFFVFLLGGATFLGFFEYYYQNKIYPGIKVAQISLSGKTLTQAEQLLQEKSNKFLQRGLFFRYKNKEVVVPHLLASPTDPDLSKEIFSWDTQTTAQKAYAIGRKGSWPERLKEQLRAFIKGRQITPQWNADTKEIKSILQENFSSWEDPGQNAHLEVSYKRGKFIVKAVPEKLGKSFAWNLALKEAQERIKEMSWEPIDMYLKTDYPQIKEKDIKKAIPLLSNVLEKAPFSLRYQCSASRPELCPSVKSISLPNQQIKEWFQVIPQKGDSYSLEINKEKAIEFLDKLASQIEVLPQDAKFKIEEGRVVEFQESRDGLKINKERTIAQIEKDFLHSTSSSSIIFLETALAVNNIEKVNDLGIKEIIGIGKSSFAGSPPNRRHNIKTGVKKLNGLLIKPGEEFSLLKALGEVNEKTGYLPELVIKGNRTVPEYGGGLCQIATTVFRAALYSGLPITERRPHAYRVSYYEPAGMDATIYIPHPDLKFINDTGHYILIQGKIEGDNLTFEFWGTSDGRKVEISEPKIFNIIKPEPTKIIETTDLPPGEKKCTEHSHNGADALFFRKISYQNKEPKEEKWFSRYRPWRAVCLIGKEKEATSTEEIISH